LRRRRHDHEQSRVVGAAILDRVTDTCGCQYDGAAALVRVLVADGKMASAVDDDVDLVRLRIGVRFLRLPRREAVDVDPPARVRKHAVLLHFLNSELGKRSELFDVQRPLLFSWQAGSCASWHAPPVPALPRGQSPGGRQVHRATFHRRSRAYSPSYTGR